MKMLSVARSQINNVRHFQSLFSLPRLAKSAVTLPLEYVSPSAGASLPLVINFLTASRCNLKCTMCYADKLMPAGAKEMTSADYEHVVRQTLDFKPTYFFGGGEPFLRRDILDVVGAVKKHGMRVGMVTNGLGVTPERGGAIKRLGVESMMFSVHGTESVHDGITQAKGSYRQVIENVRAFCRGPRQTQVLLNFVLQPDNVDDVFSLAEVAREIGVDQLRVDHLMYMTPAETSTHDAFVRAHAPESIRGHLGAGAYVPETPLPADYARRLSANLDRLKAKYGDFLFIKPYLGSTGLHDWYSDSYDSQRACLFIWRSLFVNPQGDVLPCTTYPDMKFGNVTKEPLLDIWNSSGYRDFRRTIRARRLPACARCCKT